MGAPRNPKYIKDRKIMGEKKQPRIHTREDIVSFKKKYRSTPYEENGKSVTIVNGSLLKKTCH